MSLSSPKVREIDWSLLMVTGLAVLLTALMVQVTFLTSETGVVETTVAVTVVVAGESTVPAAMAGETSILPLISDVLMETMLSSRGRLFFTLT